MYNLTGHIQWLQSVSNALSIQSKYLDVQTNERALSTSEPRPPMISAAQGLRPCYQDEQNGFVIGMAYWLLTCYSVEKTNVYIKKELRFYVSVYERFLHFLNVYYICTEMYYACHSWKRYEPSRGTALIYCKSAGFGRTVTQKHICRFDSSLETGRRPHLIVSA